jgi:hypothetical protein
MQLQQQRAVRVSAGWWRAGGRCLDALAPFCCCCCCRCRCHFLRALQELRALAPWVTVILASAPLAAPADIAAYEAWVQAVPDAHIRQWKEQPGNYALMTKQGALAAVAHKALHWRGLMQALLPLLHLPASSPPTARAHTPGTCMHTRCAHAHAGYAVTTALSLAKAAKVSWLIHLDPDELLHPGASHSAGVLAGSYSLLPELCATPSHVPSIRCVCCVCVCCRLLMPAPAAGPPMGRFSPHTQTCTHKHTQVCQHRGRARGGRPHQPLRAGHALQVAPPPCAAPDPAFPVHLQTGPLRRLAAPVHKRQERRAARRAGRHAGRAARVPGTRGQEVRVCVARARGRAGGGGGVCWAAPAGARARMRALLARIDTRTPSVCGACHAHAQVGDARQPAWRVEARHLQLHARAALCVRDARGRGRQGGAQLPARRCGGRAGGRRQQGVWWLPAACVLLAASCCRAAERRHVPAAVCAHACAPPLPRACVCVACAPAHAPDRRRSALCWTWTSARSWRLSGTGTRPACRPCPPAPAHTSRRPRALAAAWWTRQAAAAASCWTRPRSLAARQAAA